MEFINYGTAAAYYRFENGALTTSTSTTAHDLTAISDPAEDVNGVFGSAIALDGNDAYSAVNHADFRPTGAFSIGAWFKSSSTAANQYVFHSHSANTNIAGIYIGTIITTGVARITSGKNTGTTANTDYKTTQGTSNCCDGKWHFIVGTWSPISDKLRIYVDGSLEGEEAWTSAPAYAATNYVRIGCYCATGTNSLFTTGSIDDVFLINGTELTATDVADLYKNYTTINII
jgi:hypothetical protein